MKKLNEHDIQELIAKPETTSLECKAGKGGLPGSLWESYSAFANTDGGIILIGVSEIGGHFEITGVPKPDKMMMEIWNTINNRQKVSINILFSRCVYDVVCGKKTVVVIDVPRAMREERPVYIGGNPYGGTWRREGEGDYRCSKEAVNAMIRDNASETIDHRLVENMGVGDLNADSIRRYRNIFSIQRPDNPWNEADNVEFLLRIGAAGRDANGGIHPNLAGLIFFGNYNDILKECPHYFVDYREHIATDERYSDRVSPLDLTWSGNVFDFYFRVIDRLTADVKTPFKLNEQLLRVDDTPVHKALRECLANALIHADYMGTCGIVVEKYFRKVSFANPGCLRVPKRVAIEGGNSNPRNEQLFNLFVYINIGEKLGSGLPQLFAIWKKHQWPEPELKETWNPERTVLSLQYPNLEVTEETGEKTEETDGKNGEKTDGKTGEKTGEKTDGKNEEASGKTEETDGKTSGKTEETGGKTEETGGKTGEKTDGKTEETGGKTEETGGKTEETGGKTEETGGKTEETGEKTDGKTEETGGKTEETSEKTDGKTEETSEKTSGKTEKIGGKTKEKILELMSGNPKITIPEICISLSRADSSVREHIHKLRKQGVLTRIGSKKGGYWQVLKR